MTLCGWRSMVKRSGRRCKQNKHQPEQSRLNEKDDDDDEVDWAQVGRELSNGHNVLRVNTIVVEEHQQEGGVGGGGDKMESSDAASRNGGDGTVSVAVDELDDDGKKCVLSLTKWNIFYSIYKLYRLESRI